MGIFPSDIYEVDPVTGQSPLMVAASIGHENIVKLLLSTGRVNIAAMDLAGHTARELAEENGHKHIVELLSPYNKDSIRGLLYQKEDIMQ
jgi:ankyrin repeat protein